ncbi:hypothetical protein GSI_07552 [Ganoderma sinense ZZ0214-1]|uniref:Uncharacterized protein n=1 Tax=Ganoderma sinense ZZ0214-1 TaxID=1077348 RepID=A0A2G8S9D8_9APHY|nr:hypothetical protein GSI_07552 [Ganoderma sinense ZZ0214-1]
MGVDDYPALGSSFVVASLEMLPLHVLDLRRHRRRWMWTQYSIIVINAPIASDSAEVSELAETIKPFLRSWVRLYHACCSAGMTPSSRSSSSAMLSRRPSLVAVQRTLGSASPWISLSDSAGEETVLREHFAGWPQWLLDSSGYCNKLESASYHCLVWSLPVCLG